MNLRPNGHSHQLPGQEAASEAQWLFYIMTRFDGVSWATHLLLTGDSEALGNDGISVLEVRRDDISCALSTRHSH